jgi:hypothetical protein
LRILEDSEGFMLRESCKDPAMILQGSCKDPARTHKDSARSYKTAVRYLQTLAEMYALLAGFATFLQEMYDLLRDALQAKSCENGPAKRRP